MSESRKRRPRSRTVVVDAPPPAAITVTVKDQTLPMVVPRIKTMLQDLKLITASELTRLKNMESIGDTTGQRLRNLAATVASVMESERKEAEGPSGLEGATRAELAAALRAELAELEKEDNGDA